MQYYVHILTILVYLLDRKYCVFFIHSLKGQCHGIFKYFFLTNYILLVPLEAHWDYFDFGRIFPKIFRMVMV